MLVSNLLLFHSFPDDILSCSCSFCMPSPKELLLEMNNLVFFWRIFNEFENTTKMLEESANSLSNEIVGAGRAVIEISSGQKSPTRGDTPPPDYSESCRWSVTIDWSQLASPFRHYKRGDSTKHHFSAGLYDRGQGELGKDRGYLGDSFSFVRQRKHCTKKAFLTLY